MAHRADAGIACGGLTNTAGSSATVDSVRLAATGPSGSRSANRRLTMMGAVAYPRVASRTRAAPSSSRSEEHTSELQSPCNLVCRLLLEKKKKNTSTLPSHVVMPTACYV